MGLITLNSNQVIHRSGDKVESLEIVVKGSVSVSANGQSITIGTGGILGVAEKPGAEYIFTYSANEDSSIFSYAYTDISDIYKVVKCNPKIAPILAAQSVKTVVLSLDKYNDDYETIQSEYDRLDTDRASYPMMAVSVGMDVETFPELDDIEPPVKEYALSEWQEKYFRSLNSKEDLMKKACYCCSSDIANGFIMNAVEALSFISACRDKLWEYKRGFQKETGKFYQTMQLAKAKSDDLKRTGSDDGVLSIDIHNALNTILQYADTDEEVTENFKKAVTEFKNSTVRNDTTDESRLLRRNVAKDFYSIYTAVFLRSLKDPHVPSEIMMFLMFGFVDENLAGLENTRQLYALMKTYTPDPEGRVVTIYEWLKKIYSMELEPSRNEFDEDYFTALRTLKTNGEISEEQMEFMKLNPLERLKFEIKNLFALGNRMTFGRPTTFVPVFDAENVIRPLESAYITTQRINDFYESIKTIDFSLFCRQTIYSNPEIGITQAFVDEDIMPYTILMPNMGSRASLWQEIEGKRRTTPARFIISIFNTETLEDVMIRLCGEFRWEMCKTMQGVHWNDVTDPSLTSMFCDYLQFYKKNHSLSTDMKEKLRGDLKRYSNNFKNVFIADYISYIKFESSSSPRLNKVSREILFTYCPFSREYREKLVDSPIYSELIKKHSARTGSLARPLSNMIRKVRNEGNEVPTELLDQFDYLQK